MKRHVIIISAGIACFLLMLIPAMPLAISILLSLAFFALVLLPSYLKSLKSKGFVSENLAILLAAVALIVSGQTKYAILTMLFFYIAEYYFGLTHEKTLRRIDEWALITAPYANRLLGADIIKTKTAELTPGQKVLLKEGDIIPCDGTVTAGEAKADYTNIFGQGELSVLTNGSPCFSGGIVQSGSVVFTVQKPHNESLAYILSERTKKAHAPSPLRKKITRYIKIIEPVMMAAAILMFTVLFIVTKDIKSSANIASVILIASGFSRFVKAFNILYHNTLLNARKKGIIFSSTKQLEAFSRIEALALNDFASDTLARKTEDSDVIPVNIAKSEVDGKLFRTKAELELDKSEILKVAVGFYSTEAHANITDGKAARVTSAIRVSKAFKNILYQNALCVMLAKLALISFAFLFNMSAVAAVLIEFAAAMICLLNSSKNM